MSFSYEETRHVHEQMGKWSEGKQLSEVDLEVQPDECTRNKEVVSKRRRKNKGKK